ncbi:MAG: bifunctional pyr operon transcriptional regulator/uracil phosphoribosyltransferase PyrR [Methylococcales bacterium]|nr:bifunctional pyr operon transcriptional regulator/uracil phosphoribosyltransferase PyrR [Methylococcales bacterium]
MTASLPSIPTLLDNLENDLKIIIAIKKLKNPLMIGIHSGGVWIAKELHQRLNIQEPLGLMDISFYRDDFSQIGIHPEVKPSQLPYQMEDRDIILVDDVFYTGRTSRAALNEIFDYGRPRHIVLAVLIERDGQEIPLKPNCAGCTFRMPAGQRLKLTGPEPLAIDIQSFSS